MLDRRTSKIAFSKLSKKIKNFLLSPKSREFFIFLIFFFIASGFWMLQTLNNEYETNFSLPVRLKNVPDDIIMTSEIAPTVQVTVKDRGTVLLNYILGKSFFPVNIDFASYTNMGSHIKIASADFGRRVQTQLSASTRLMSIKPDTLEYIYTTGDSKKVPVKLRGKISAGRQYYVSDTLFMPDSVMAFAPKEILKTLSVAFTEEQLAEEITDTLNIDAKLTTLKGVKFVPNTVKLSSPVDRYTEKTIEVPLHGINFPPNSILRTFPSKVQVTFQVGMSRFKEITEEDFAIEISHQELRELTSEKYTVKLSVQPKGISNIRINPSEVDFLIERISTND
ncbi:YbbR-like domain-containing protein [Bacteroides sp. 214]|uniref:YbbR-like domain-containing protein n=1 Tax=Bacteroides sp. 214 TaxID=2302935 RepID=UPI0013D0C613|nr:YbbR-like domain-containing protein [Bacteroides sp. 214]NDW13807.1 YbbR-like domain-containing protein [Bacteroides sp. 214]